MKKHGFVLLWLFWFFNSYISKCSYCTDLLVEVLVLVYLKIEGILAKEKVWETQFPYLPKNVTLQLKCRVRFLDFFHYEVKVPADNVNKTEFH